MFRFLSGNQVLELEELLPRQQLSQSLQPVRRKVPLAAAAKDDTITNLGLLYLFVSHRWETKNKPDQSLRQLRTLQGWLRLVEELLLFIVAKKPINWSCNLEEMKEGIPQAATVVTKIAQFISSVGDEQTDAMLQSPLDHIWIWYDCSCLPQSFPNGRTADEQTEFRHALRNLDSLIGQCVLVSLRSSGDDYEQRAWCSFEVFQNSLSKLKNRVQINCDDFLNGSAVDCSIVDASAIERSTSAEMYNTKLAANLIMQTFRRKRFGVLQKLWNTFVNEVHAEESSGRDRLNLVPDMFNELQTIRGQPVGASKDETPPFQKAMQQVVRELQWAVFSMSCRDAATFADACIPSECNTCIPNTGITCGLHCQDKVATSNLEDRHRRLLQYVETCSAGLQFPVDLSTDSSILCPNGHRLQPGIAVNPLHCDCSTCSLENNMIPFGDIHAVCDTCDFDICVRCALHMNESTLDTEGVKDSSSQEALELLMHVLGVRFSLSDTVDDNAGKADVQACGLCERRVSIDLYGLVFSLVSRFGQRCTNNSDAVFVCLLALGNLLLGDEGIRPLPEKASVDKNADAAEVAVFYMEHAVEFAATSSHPARLSTGSLRHLRKLFLAAVSTARDKILRGEPLAPFRVEIVVRCPRWVLLDAANATISFSSSLIDNECLSLGTRVEEFFEKNPTSISFTFNDVEEFTPLSHRFCAYDSTCHSVWAPCHHSTQAKVQPFSRSFEFGPSSLDSWSSIKLPSPLCSFSVVSTNDCIYIVGGAPDISETVHECSDIVFIGTLPLTSNTEWLKCARLKTGRHRHASCLVQTEDGNSQELLVSGGYGVVSQDQDLVQRLSSIEVWRIENGNEQQMTLCENSCFEMPLARAGHFILEHEGSLFVCGGETEDPTHDQDCWVLNFADKLWFDGPKLPAGFRVGGCTLIGRRFAALCGVVTGDSTESSVSWILDLNPWFEWGKTPAVDDFSTGRNGAGRPTTTWMPGPHFPLVARFPNICTATSSSTGREEDWVLSVSPVETGYPKPWNLCFGLPIKDPKNCPEFWAGLEWRELGLAPDTTILGSNIVTDGGILTAIGGYSLGTCGMSGIVHCRPLSVAHTLPVPVSAHQEFRGGDRHFLEHQNAILNDIFLVGRLGLPITEDTLYSEDGAKRLFLIPPRPAGTTALHCQRCLLKHQSAERARMSQTTHFGLRATGTSRRMILCSQCLCHVLAL